MKVQECWCGNCSAGQMEQIHDIMFSEKKGISEMIGRKIICTKCGYENVIEDVLSIIPNGFLVASQNDMSKIKSNQELSNWLNAE